MREEHAECAEASVVYLCRRERASERDMVVFSSSDTGGMVIVKELKRGQHLRNEREENDVLEFPTTLVQLLVHARQLILRRLSPPR